MQYKLPPLCARCGVKPATQVKTLRKYSIGIHPLTLLTMFIGFSMLRTKKSSIKVPVCDECNSRLELLATLAILSRIVIVVAGFALILQLAQDNQLILCLVVLVVGSLGLQFLPDIINPTLGSYKDGFFRFKNANFQRAFGELNPNLVMDTRFQWYPKTKEGVEKEDKPKSVPSFWD